MKQLTWKIILPLTQISFVTFTKWWYALPVDAPDTLLWGFPFIFVGEAWHTSMSLQFFLLELFADVAIYFLFWFIVVFCVNQFLRKIKPHKILVLVLWILSAFVISVETIIVRNSDSIFYLKNPFEMELMDTGYVFIWQQMERPDYAKYHQEIKSN